MATENNLMFFNVNPNVDDDLLSLTEFTPPDYGSTIIVEDKLEAIFKFLPVMGYKDKSMLFKPIFGYGDQKELNSFLKSKESLPHKPYPLIWLLYPYKEVHHKKVVKLDGLKLILAVNTNDKMLNEERIATNYRNILIPLQENIFRVLKRAVNVRLVEKVEIYKYPNYSDNNSSGDSSFTTDLWDALSTVWSIEINDSCLRDIKI